MVIVITNHAPLVEVEKRAQPTFTNGRLVRMLEHTKGYCIELYHVKRPRNLFADELSRQPLVGEGGFPSSLALQLSLPPSYGCPAPWCFADIRIQILLKNNDYFTLFMHFND